MMFRSKTTDIEQHRITVAWHKVKHLWWVRKELVGSYGATELCRRLGGHVRFANGPRRPHITIARWSATARGGYRHMTFEEFIHMNQYGRFPLRRAAC